MSERPSVFRGVSSLPSGFTGTVDQARFGKNPKYTIKSGPQAGQMPVVLSFNIVSDELDEPLDHILTIGNGWVAENNGTNVMRENAKPGKDGFQDNSNAMLWIDRLFEIDEAAVMSHFEDTQYPPQDARFWDGLTSVFEREKYRAFDGQDRERLMPTESVSWDEAEVEKPKAKPAKKAAARKKAASKPKAETNGEGEIDPAVLARIDAIADDSETHDDFIASVFGEIPDAAEEPLYSKVMEGEDVEGSIWQRAFARAEA